MSKSNPQSRVALQHSFYLTVQLFIGRYITILSIIPVVFPRPYRYLFTIPEAGGISHMEQDWPLFFFCFLIKRIKYLIIDGQFKLPSGIRFTDHFKSVKACSHKPFSLFQHIPVIFPVQISSQSSQRIDAFR